MMPHQRGTQPLLRCVLKAANCEGQSINQIPSAFVVTGPNIASQDLLFEQLSESLGQQSTSRFVRLKSSEAVTLKAALKKTIRDAMATVVDGDDEDLQVEGTQDVSFPNPLTDGALVFRQNRSLLNVFAGPTIS